MGASGQDVDQDDDSPRRTPESTPQTYAGQRLLAELDMVAWFHDDFGADVRDVEREATAVIREQLAEVTEDRPTDPDDEWHRGYREAIFRVRVAANIAPVANPDPALAYAPDGAVVGHVIGYAQSSTGGRVPVLDPTEGGPA